MRNRNSFKAFESYGSFVSACLKSGRFILAVSFAILILEACSSAGKHNVPDELSVPHIKDPVILKLKGEKGRVELTKNCSRMIADTYIQDSLAHRTVEDLDFTSRTTTTGVKDNGNLLQNVETLNREGAGLLHDLAFPEPGEVIAMEVTSDGQVVKAGNFPKNSLFYLPPVPLPKEALVVGATWHSHNKWTSENTSQEMTVNMTMTYKGQKVCGESRCIEVMVSGEVLPPKPMSPHVKFTHSISGRYLFEPKRGLLVWGEFSSDEQLQAGETRAVAHSVLRSIQVEPPGYHTASREEPDCPFEKVAR